MSPSTSLDSTSGKDVDENTYRGMIGSLLYLTVSGPDILFSVCKYARFQSAPKESHLIVVKRIIRFLIGTQDTGLWHPCSYYFDLIGYSDADFAGNKNDRKSTSGTCQILRNALISWHSKKQTSFALSTTEVKYIVVRGCATQNL
ncbi:secreted RxLR effector protein 161-like [Capsicum annuum]|uniref:secreted RxLR effector protein 161-like n=1 Tax=Capsicum annuum TaxID=4072 RepID=UPI001FB0B1DA|nr:secreted RxLR effector protein 161-like [Capsicum annuum]